MALYDRLLGRDDAGGPVEGKIRLHGFNALLGEVARGRLTNAQARDAVPLLARGVPLTAAEGQEALTPLGTISGSATAKLGRAKEIEDVLTLAEAGVTQYDTPAEVQARLGV